MWDNERVIQEIEKNNRGDKVIVKEVSKNGKYYVDIRNYFVDNEGELKPTRKGIALPFGLVDQVAESLNSVLEEEQKV